MSNVLVTGANGYIAAHIVDQLISAGHTVVGTVRSPAKGAELLALHPSWASNLTFATIPDLTAADAFDAVLQINSFDYIIHTASPAATNISGTELFDAAIEGTKSILSATKRLAPSVKRVVITGSIASMLDLSKGLRPGYIYSDKDWAPYTRESALGQPWIIEYLASKTLAEKATWEFVETEKPVFDVVVLNPPMVFGPPIHNIFPLAKASQSVKFFYDFINGSHKEIPDSGFWAIADVRDVAVAHVLAMDNRGVSNKRVLIARGNWSYQQVANILHERFSELKGRVPRGTPGQAWPEGGVYGVDNALSTEVLGLKYRSLEEIAVDMANALLDAEKKENEAQL